MLIVIFAFILIVRALLWGLVTLRAHDLERNISNYEAKGLVANQKFAALSFLLETAFWFMLITPNTPLSISDSDISRWVIVGLFTVQILPAGFAWLWWTGRFSARRKILEYFQAFFGVVTVATIITGIFVILWTILQNIG